MWTTKLAEGPTVTPVWEGVAFISRYYGMSFTAHTSDLTEISGSEWTLCSLLETCKKEAFDDTDVHQSLCPSSDEGFKAAETLMLLSASLLMTGVSARGYYEVADLSMGLEFIALMVH